MATIDLFTPSAHPDGWRRVIAPGGYECWEFEAHDGERRIKLGFWLGHPQDRRYVNRYRAYMARPTRTAPPVPADYPSLAVGLMPLRSDVAPVLERLKREDFRAASDCVDVVLSDSRVTAPGDGEYAVQINAMDSNFYAGLTFRGTPLLKCVDEETDHSIVILQDAEVKGELRVGGRDIDFVGRGSHSHLFGTRFPTDTRAEKLFGCQRAE